MFASLCVSAPLRFSRCRTARDVDRDELRLHDVLEVGDLLVELVIVIDQAVRKGLTQEQLANPSLDVLGALGFTKEQIQDGQRAWRTVGKAYLLLFLRSVLRGISCCSFSLVPRNGFLLRITYSL